MINRIKIVTLYKFTTLEELDDKKVLLETFCRHHSIKGLLLIAPEGFNGTLAGAGPAVDSLIAYFKSDEMFGSGFNGVELKYSHADDQPFMRLKVKIKPEIVTLRAPEADPNEQVGTYVAPKNWNALVDDPDLVMIDTRNDYEVALGTFKGALDPKTENFTEFRQYVADNLDPKKHKKIAIFCTGGIRCEKASSYMLSQGFEEVYHLKGGILQYLEDVPAEDTRWQGECFVFDDRVSVGQNLLPGNYTLCRCCRTPLSAADLEHKDYIEGIHCHHCVHKGSQKKLNRAKERQKQIELAKKRGQEHLGEGAIKAAQQNKQRTKQLKRAQRALNAK